MLRLTFGHILKQQLSLCLRNQSDLYAQAAHQIKQNSLGWHLWYDGDSTVLIQTHVNCIKCGDIKLLGLAKVVSISSSNQTQSSN